MLIIDKPPLVSFRIDFKFQKPKKITFEIMAEVEKVLKKTYPNVPNISIIEYPFPVDVPIQIGPIKFLTDDRESEIQLFSNGLIFIFTKYSHWEDIKNKIINILFSTCNILNIKSIEEFRIEYIDEFLLPKESFNLFDYFNLNLNIPKQWDLDYNDFHLGIKINTEQKDKFIIRLRGVHPKVESKNLIRLESLYIKNEILIIDKKDELIEYLDKIHALIEKYFLDIMSERIKNELGVKMK